MKRCGARVLIATAALALVGACQAQSFTVLTNFSGSQGGPQPGLPPLARDTAGNLYGVSATSSNTQNCQYYACGFIYRLDPTGKITILYTFKGPPDGSWPEAVTLDAQGNVYGTTQYGGTSNLGTVFKLDPAGNETVLHSFAGPPNDGQNPQGGLVRDIKGNLYGTTLLGGTGGCFGIGCGVVFKIGPTGKEIVLYRFTDGTDGALPGGNLVLASGALWGTTGAGGDLSCSPPGTNVAGCGTVFKLEGHIETVLYSFKGPPDGIGGGYIVRDRAGNIYGTSSTGGDIDSNCVLGTIGCGTIFKLDPNGKETILYTFHEPFGADGFNIEGVIMDPKGNLYGSAESGTIFEVSASGNFRVVYSFANGNGACCPGMLTMDQESNIYGTAPPVVFMLTP